jgi:hypothetical protein
MVARWEVRGKMHVRPAASVDAGTYFAIPFQGGIFVGTVMGIAAEGVLRKLSCLFDGAGVPDS